MATIASLASNEKTIKKIFNNEKEFPKDHQVTANLWSAGQKYRVTVDDLIPGTIKGTTFNQYAARLPKDGALWVLMLEKALAK
jgi:hypothetical protein